MLTIVTDKSSQLLPVGGVFEVDVFCWRAGVSVGEPLMFTGKEMVTINEWVWERYGIVTRKKVYSTKVYSLLAAYDLYHSMNSV